MKPTDSAHVAGLALRVERSAGPADSPPSFACLVDPDQPWPGLAPFTEDQSAFFHGRDEEIRALTRLMERKALTVLFGQSGLGKSSLLQAGVFPRLRAASFCPIYIRLDHSEGAPSPTEQVKTMVADAASRAGTWTKPGSAKPGESLWEFFHHRDDRLIDANGRTIVPVLVFDQFEELFTLGAAAGAQRDRAVAFMSELAELVENRPSEKLVERLDRSSEEMDAFDFSRTDYRVCISLREDYLPHLEGLKTIMPALMENRMRLTQMSGTQALDAVLKPGAGLVSEDVARAIVEFVSGARGGSVERLAELDVEPPLLSVICRELNDRRRALGQAQITADLVTGNRREILTDFYERSVSDLPEGMRRFVEDKLLTKSGFRDNLALETALEEPGVAKALIDTLVARRLLRIEDRIGTQRVELTHDVLADVVRASRDERQQRLALEQAAARERQALVESAHRTRRMRFAITGLIAAVIALSIGAVFGLRAQRRSAEQASQTDLRLASRLLDERKLGDGLAYLVRAGEKDPTHPLIAPRLLTTLTAHNFALPVGTPLVLPSPALGAGYSEDGKTIGVECEDDVIRVLNVAEWKIERELSFGQKVRRGGIAAARNNARVLAVMLADGSILVCDGATGKPRFKPIKSPEPVGARAANFEMSADGRWVAAGNATKVWVWDANSGELRATLPNDGGYYRRFALSPDGRRILTTHGNRVTQMWSLPDGAPVGEPIVRNTTYVLAPKFSADGRRWLLFHYRGISIGDTETGQAIRPDIALNGATTDDVWLTPDGTRLVYSASDQTINVVDVESGKSVYPPLVHGGLILDVQFKRNGKVLFTNCVDGLFRCWDLDSGKLLAEPMWKHERFTPAACSPDGSTIAVFAGSLVYRLKVGRGPAAPLILPRDQDRVAFVNFMATAPARNWWLTPTEARVMDVASGRWLDGGFAFPTPIPRNYGGIRSGYGDTLEAGQVLIPRIDGKHYAWTWGERGIARNVPMQDVSARTTSFTQNPKGNLAAGIGSDDGRAVGIWDKRTGARVSTIAAIPAAIGGVALSPDEKLIAIRTTPDQSIRIFEISSAKELLVLELSGRAQFGGYRFNLAGTQLLTGDSWGGVQAWDVRSGKMIHSTPVHRTNVTRFEYSPDGKYYASLSTDGSVQVWEDGTHKPVGDPLSQTGRAFRASFSPTGGQIATPSQGGTARIWDIRSGLPLNEPMDHQGEAVSIPAYSPDGRFVTMITEPNSSGLRYNFMWPAPPDGRGARTPQWLLDLGTIVAGRRVTTEGKFITVRDEFSRIEQIRHQVAALPTDDPYAEWARWFLSDDPTRSIAPRFTITPAEARKLRDELAAPAAAATAPATSSPTVP